MPTTPMRIPVAKAKPGTNHSTNPTYPTNPIYPLNLLNNSFFCDGVPLRWRTFAMAGRRANEANMT